MDWFRNCFIPQMERYLVEQNLAFKVLLLVDNTPGHPGDPMAAHWNVKVIFLPPNSHSITRQDPATRPSKGIISTFKTYYTHRTFRCILDAMDPELTIGQCWKEFNIAHCIGTIKESLDEVRASTINACWHNL